jgi:apolipoprotein D and lipocalin family protein
MTKYIFALLLVVSCSSTKDKGQTVVDHVDLEKFMGNWFEIARYEIPAQKDCGRAKITYKLHKYKIDMVHACFNKFNGELEHSHGVAEVVEKSTNARWKASYVPMFQNWGMFGGSIWIIGLDPEYRFAILGHPTHKHFWIISRTPVLEPELYDEAVKLAEEKGYKAKLIVKAPMWY